MRIQLSAPVVQDAVEYTHVEVSLAMSQMGEGTSVACSLVPCVSQNGSWAKGTALAIVGSSSTDQEIAGFTALIEEALAALMAAKGL